MATKTNTEINGNKYYKLKRTIGHNLDGEPIVKYFYGTSKGNAEAKYKQFLQEQAQEKYDKQLALDTSTLHSRANEYIDNVLKVTSKYRNSTKIRYESGYRAHIEGTWLDNMLVKNILPLTVQKFYNELLVSKPTLEGINKFMQALYKWLSLNGYANNILTAVELPEKEHKPRHSEIDVWSDSELEILKTKTIGTKHHLLIMVLIYTGMRISEVLALKYSDIRDGVIHVDRQCYDGELAAPKCNSNRTIPIHPNLSIAIEEHKAAEGEKESDYIFTSKAGTLYNYRNLSRSMSRLYESIGVPNKSFHAYRSTFCTNLCCAGVPIEVASKLLGHKSLEVTAKHYALIKQESKEDAINRLK